MLKAIFEVLRDYIHTCLDSLYILWMVFLIFTISLSASASTQSERITDLENELSELRVEIQELKEISVTEDTEIDVQTLKAEDVQVVAEPIRAFTEVKPCNTTATFKSYMDYRAITNRASRQWALQQEAVTNINGLRYYEGRIMVAMANREVGEMLDIVLDGQVLEVVVGDIKGNTNCQHPDGSILEFIVDVNVMDGLTRQLGNYNHIYNGPIKLLRVYS